MSGTIVPEVIIDDNGLVQSVRVDMGEPVLLCSDIPFISQNRKSVEEPLRIGDKEYSITAVGMGNSHGVIFVDDINQMDVKKIGPIIETHERFPEKPMLSLFRLLTQKS